MARPRAFIEEEALLSALDLFWEKGFHATSMQDLVDGLQISRASLYSTFGDKRQLFDRAMQQYQQVNHQKLRQLLSQLESPKEAFRYLFVQTLEQNLKDPARKGCFFVNTTTELAARDEALQQFLKANQQQVERIFKEFLNESQAKGLLPTNRNTAALSSLLFTFYSGLQVTSKLQPERAAAIDMIEEVLRHF